MPDGNRKLQCRLGKRPTGAGVFIQIVGALALLGMFAGRPAPDHSHLEFPGERKKDGRRYIPEAEQLLESNSACGRSASGDGAPRAAE
jgi:hypothetical protein